MSPLKGHSLTSGGLSIHVAFACSMNGSLMMFTTNSLVALIFLGVSFRPLGMVVTESEMSGGLCVTMLNQLHVRAGAMSILVAKMGSRWVIPEQCEVLYAGV